MHRPHTQDDDCVVQALRSMSKALAFCGDDTRYDLQRNLVEILEEITGQLPLPRHYHEAVSDVVETVIHVYGGVGKVHVALRRAADSEGLAKHPPADNDNKENVISFTTLKDKFMEFVQADYFLVDWQLARRFDDGDMCLTNWGRYILEHLDAKQRKVITPEYDSSNARPSLAL